jgi:hypothetical protein
MTLLNVRILPLLSAEPLAEAASCRADPRAGGSRLVARYGWPIGFPTEKTREAARLQRLPPQNLPPFCQHGLDPKLDNHRFKGNNTHELIVLPAFRQVLPAKCFGWRQQANYSLPAAKGPPHSPSGLLFGAGGYSVGALALGLKLRLILAKTSAADRR